MFRFLLRFFYILDKSFFHLNRSVAVWAVFWNLAFNIKRIRKSAFCARSLYFLTLLCNLNWVLNYWRSHIQSGFHNCWLYVRRFRILFLRLWIHQSITYTLSTNCHFVHGIDNHLTWRFHAVTSLAFHKNFHYVRDMFIVFLNLCVAKQLRWGIWFDNTMIR